MWLFHFHSTVKIQPFSPVFSLAGSTAKACCRLSLWSFKEKRINCFLWHSHEQQAVWCHRRYLLCRRFRRFSLWRKAGRGIGFGCIIKWFMSSFVPERDKQLPQTWGLPTGKLKWKALPLPCGGDEIATFYDSVVFSVGSVIVCGFSSPQCVENTAFFSGFPLGGIHG